MTDRIEVASPPQYRVVIEPADGHFRAICPALPGVEGRGESPHRAASALRRRVAERLAQDPQGSPLGLTPAAKVLRLEAYRSSGPCGGAAPSPETGLTAPVREAFDRLLRRSGFEGSQVWSTALGLRTFSLESGQGFPLVLLHGGGGGSGLWVPLLSRLVESFRVIAPDIPPFGLSDPVDWTEESFDELAPRWLRAFLEVRGGGPVHLAGHSMGGKLALLFAARYPDQVDRLILMSPAGVGREIPWGFRLLGSRVLGPALTVLLARRGIRRMRWLVRRTGGFDLQALPSELATYMEVVGERIGYGRSFRALNRQFFDLRGQVNRIPTSRLGGVRHRSLILWGARDQIFPFRQGLRLGSLLPRAQLEILPRGGHLLHLSDPDGVAEQLVRFLERREGDHAGCPSIVD